MTHGQLVTLATRWLRSKYGCGVVLSEQACCTGEMPDVIGWKGKCRSVVIECKVSRADFLADRTKPWRLKPEIALGCERFYAAPKGMLRVNEIPPSWGLLEQRGNAFALTLKPARNSQRTSSALMSEMNLLLSSLRRVELRIEPRTITDFLKWKNRLADYNGGNLPEGVPPIEEEQNSYISANAAD